MSNSMSKPLPTKTASAAQPQSSEPTFNILPHPAKTNDPADLQPGQGGGLKYGSGGAFDAFNTPGPFIPDQQMKSNFPQPLSHEELQAQQAQLNQLNRSNE
ncbi:hypothetical protein CVT24_002366 [Panaeolus cyanescens]|uniref:Uncharacterized protein n=1 Tax=Panaeolus cyanescens TaxID=181874 RepID=A0A409W108_9AGAR|nr:hypothetical protein CVT24_002366 [Panaeolus cyanescens]